MVWWPLVSSECVGEKGRCFTKKVSVEVFYWRACGVLS